MGDSPKNVAIRLSTIAGSAGAGGLVLSGKELEFLKYYQGDLVVPGIRPSYLPVSNDDQSRTMTPKDALVGGASHLVIGRPIIEAENPLEALHQILKEIE